MDQQTTVSLAKKSLEDIISFFGINIDIEAKYNDEIIELNVPSSEYNSLFIGRNAETLRSIQYIISTILRSNNAMTSRVNIDIADYKKQRAEKLSQTAHEWVKTVQETGDSYIANLNAADRRIVHHVVSQYDDISSFSEGEGRDRRIIIAQKSS